MPHALDPGTDWKSNSRCPVRCPPKADQNGHVPSMFLNRTPTSLGHVLLEVLCLSFRVMFGALRDLVTVVH